MIITIKPIDQGRLHQAASTLILLHNLQMDAWKREAEDAPAYEKCTDALRYEFKRLLSNHTQQFNSLNKADDSVILAFAAVLCCTHSQDSVIVE